MDDNTSAIGEAVTDTGRRSNHNGANLLTVRWGLSHIFVASVLALLVWLGFWQLSRLSDRREQNRLIEDQLNQPASVLAATSDDQSRFGRVDDMFTVIDPHYISILSRTSGTDTGVHVVALAESSSGIAIFVNLGFVADDEVESISLADSESTVRGGDSVVRITGWLNESAEKGLLGVEDQQTSNVAPRLDIQALRKRSTKTQGTDISPYWLAAQSVEPPILKSTVERLQPPELGEGNHFSYAIQWFIFGALVAVFYYLIIKRAHRNDEETSSKSLYNI